MTLALKSGMPVRIMINYIDLPNNQKQTFSLIELPLPVLEG